MTRRAIALGAGLLVLILLVLGVKGCLDARKERALTDYARDVTQIVDETAQTRNAFFGRLNDPGGPSVTEFVNEVNADRSAMENYASRVRSLEAPGDMADGQQALELAYGLRAAAMSTIANRMSTALGDAGSARAMAVIARQMQTLLAGDVIYSEVVRPQVDGVLADNGIEGSDLPDKPFLPDTRWLDEGEVSSALGQVSGNTAGATPGVHGLGLIGAGIGGTALEAGVPVAVSGESPVVDVQVQNQGDSTENGVTVSVTVDGGRTQEQTIDTIAAGETQTASVTLTPAPSGQTELEVDVEPVPGEQVSENNSETYTVDFQ